MSPDLPDDTGAAISVLPLGLHTSMLRFKSNTAATLRWIYPFRSASRSTDQLQAQEYVSVEVKLLSGIDISLRIVSRFVVHMLHSFCCIQTCMLCAQSSPGT